MPSFTTLSEKMGVLLRQIHATLMAAVQREQDMGCSIQVMRVSVCGKQCDGNLLLLSSVLVHWLIMYPIHVFYQPIYLVYLMRYQVVRNVVVLDSWIIYLNDPVNR
jgi:hypothetical protein